jgi:hypothetical protein
MKVYSFFGVVFHLNHYPRQILILRIDFTTSTYRSPFINESMVLCSPDEEGLIYAKVGACDVPMGSRYMKSVIYHAPETALENVYVIFGL